MKFLFLFLLLVGCSSLTPQQEAKKLNEFFERQFELNVSRYPTWQTYMGRKTNYGKLNNETEEYEAESRKLTKAALRELEEFDEDNLPNDEKMSYRLFKYSLKRELAGEKWKYHYFPLNQMFGYQSETPSFLINMHRISTKEDALAYISRLKEIKRVFDERLVFLKKQEAMKIYPPEFVFPKVLEDSKNIVSGFPFTKSRKKSPLYEDFMKKIKKIKAIKRKDRRALEKSLKSALLNYVRPAYKDLVSYVKHLQTKAKGNKGVWSLPNGEDFYNYRLNVITTTEKKAQEIHNTGLAEVERIHGEMKLIMKKVKFKGSLNQFFTHMKSKKYLYPQTKAGRKAYLRDANKVIADMKKALPKLFNTFPKAKLEVKPVEAYREKSAGIAFYNGPSMEGDRPGIYYVNLYKMADNPKYKLEALAYHEAIPGHHMQISIAKEMEQLPKFRRMAGFTAYTEGWGLYSELIPKEIGFYKDPYSDFGRLSMELWRATRLVVDTGIHAKKWTREQAIDYLKKNTANSDLEIMKGIERYFIMPGQATAYKIGMLKILELRKMAKEKLKEKFSLPEFHDVVLRNGAVPLFILERNVKEWIKKKI